MSSRPTGTPTVPRLFAQLSLRTREGVHKDRGQADVAVTESVRGGQRTTSREEGLQRHKTSYSDSASRQSGQAEGRRTDRAACYSDTGVGGGEKVQAEAAAAAAAAEAEAAAAAAWQGETRQQAQRKVQIKEQRVGARDSSATRCIPTLSGDDFREPCRHL